MSKPVFLNDDQAAMLKRLEAATARFRDLPPLRGKGEAIEGARKLIEEASALGMPPVSYTGLQIYVSMYDTEMDLPEHLRDLSRLTDAG